MIPWLEGSPAFPPSEQALRTPNGLLAAGGSLNAEWLLVAYQQGIFPWFNPGEPILWWSPDPRLVLQPSRVHISRSLRKRLRRGEFEVRFDSAFSAVIAACAAPRPNAAGAGTWISAEIRQAYQQLHELGYAHSVECWQDGRLVGGLYGVALGKVFFGESMFARQTDASKVAFVHLARFLQQQAYAIIDCQVHTAHLASLGAEEIARARFGELLARHARDLDHRGRWPLQPTAHYSWE